MSIQPLLNHEDAFDFCSNPVAQEKWIEVTDATNTIYPLGVLKEGTYADLILVDGNPLEDLNLIADPDENFDLIMKDGKVYKNTLQ